MKAPERHAEFFSVLWEKRPSDMYFFYYYFHFLKTMALWFRNLYSLLKLIFFSVQLFVVLYYNVQSCSRWKWNSFLENTANLPALQLLNNISHSLCIKGLQKWLCLKPFVESKWNVNSQKNSLFSHFRKWNSFVG